MATDRTKSVNDQPNTAKTAVNASNSGKVNNQQKRTGEISTQSAAEASQTIDSADTPSDFVPEGTKLTPEALLEAACNAVASLDANDAAEKERRKDENERSKSEGCVAVLCMLRFAESFQNDDGQIDEHAMDAFLTAKGQKKSEKALSPYHRLSKYCSTSDTPKVMISKRSHVLDIIVKHKISSESLEDTYHDAEEIGPDRVKRSGMAKYLLMYQIDRGSVSDKKGKFENLKTTAIVEQATSLLTELSKRDLLPDDLVKSVLEQLARPE